MNSLYTRQETLKLNIPRSCAIVGVGGTGTWVSIALAMSGVPELFLIDPDFLEDHNRNRLPFQEKDVSRSKVDVVGDFIVSLRPDINLTKMHTSMSGDLLSIIPCEVIVDCTDRFKLQLELCDKCKELGKKYIRCGYDGTKISITSTIPKWSLEDDPNDGYEVVPSWVAPPLVAAGLAVAKIMKNPNLEVSIDIIKEVFNGSKAKHKEVTKEIKQNPGPSTKFIENFSRLPSYRAEGEGEFE